MIACSKSHLDLFDFEILGIFISASAFTVSLMYSHSSDFLLRNRLLNLFLVSIRYHNCMSSMFKSGTAALFSLTDIFDANNF